MYAKKNKPMYGKGGMAKLARYMKGGKIYAENGARVTGAKTSRLTPEEVRQYRHLYEKFGPFLRTEDFRGGFGGDELYRSIQKYGKEINKDISPRAIAALAQLAMDSEGVPVNRLNVDELEYSMPEKKLMMGNGGTVKYRSGGMMEYEQGGEVSREPKVDIMDESILVGGSMIKKAKPGGGFEYVPKPEYANERMFYVDGVPATFDQAKRAFEQTSDAGVGSDFNDYIEKYTKQRGAYDLDLKAQRESLGERAAAAGSPALLRALSAMR